ncbi:NUDIX domain-containing protein [Candidatus Woesearchaeota archaeon]|nr:NUDIX domain-containing protein [Candidatus Woesearchaeota archaeon]MBW3021803.1 NUDIX domain-containing protein [Candidatus Woesearchaeota archaeon]
MTDKPRVGFGLMILKHGKILLGKRHEDPTKADSELHGEGTWTMPGGKLEFKESFEDAAYRETLEETGVKISKTHLKLISLTNDIVQDAHFITMGFLCTEFEGEPSVMEPDEITEWMWFDIDNLPTPMYFPSEKIIRNYLDKIIYKN